MKRVRHLLFLMFLITFACDDKGPDPKGAEVFPCVLVTETNNQSGNFSNWKYYYKSTDVIDSIIQIDQYNKLIDYSFLTASGLTQKKDPMTITYDYDIRIVYNRPEVSRVPVDANGIKNTVYRFLYDGKSRVISVAETTPDDATDSEFTLKITYSDDDNVTALKYVDATGNIISTTSVAGYDTRFSPYSGIINFKFLMHNYIWNSADPGPLLSVLSANNPLDYTMQAGGVTHVRKMEYTYNDRDFPLTCDNTTSTNGVVTSSFFQTWMYVCK